MLQGLLHDQILTMLRSKQNTYDLKIINSLNSLHSVQTLPENKSVEIVTQEELEAGMLLVEPIKDKNGTILVKENTYITRSIMIELLKISAQSNSLIEPFKVIGKKGW